MSRLWRTHGRTVESRAVFSWSWIRNINHREQQEKLETHRSRALSWDKGIVVGFPNWHVSGCHFQEQVGWGTRLGDRPTGRVWADIFFYFHPEGSTLHTFWAKTRMVEKGPLTIPSHYFVKLYLCIFRNLLLQPFLPHGTFILQPMGKS